MTRYCKGPIGAVQCGILSSIADFWIIPGFVLFTAVGQHLNWIHIIVVLQSFLITVYTTEGKKLTVNFT